MNTWERQEKSSMRHKEYVARLEYDDGHGVFHGQVVNLRDTVTFQGTSVRELKKAFRDSVDDYLALCRKRGEDPEKPFSGYFSVRTDPDLHRRMSAAARVASKSLNAFIVDCLKREVKDVRV